jgi:hypothetical protein
VAGRRHERAEAVITTFVHDLSGGDRDQRDLLGGERANLAEMTTPGCRSRRASR